MAANAPADVPLKYVEMFVIQTDSNNFHVGILCFTASAFSRQQMLWMAVLPDQISYGNVWVPSER